MAGPTAPLTLVPLLPDAPWPLAAAALLLLGAAALLVALLRRPRQEALHRLGDGVLLFRADGRCSYANPAAARLLGGVPLAGRSWSQLAPDAPPGAERWVPAGVAGVEARRSADARVVQLREVPPTDPALRRHQAQLEEAQRAAGLGSWAWDVASGTVEWSRELFRIYGRDPDHFTVTLESFLGCVHPSDRAATARAVQNAMLAGGDFRWEERIVRPDGGVRLLETVGWVERGADGPLRMLGTCRDVTDQREAERRLRATKAVLEAIVRASPLAIIAMDPEGRVTEWNPAAERIFGWRREEAVGRFNPAIPPRDAQAFSELLRQIRSGPEVRRLETKRVRRDGSEVDITLSAAALHDEGGAAVGSVAVLTDDTERRRAEEILRQTQQQLAASQKMDAVGRLAGGIAHDFNNLLTVIQGHADLLLDDDALTGEPRQDLEEISSAARRAAALTRQLLAFSRQQVLRMRVCDLNEVVRDMERMLGRLIGEHIRLEVRLEPELGAVRADTGQLEQVLLNLVVNARDAMAEGGRLEIVTANHRVDAAAAAAFPYPVQPGRYVSVTVRDTGHGMDDMTLARVFEPFFTTKEVGRGTGLGLSTVYGIVKQSGGHVWAQSEPGVGSAFHVYLPLHEG